MMLAYNIAVLAGLSMMLVLVLINIGAFRRLPARKRDVQLPSLSVIIPARNEEMNLHACLASLSTQVYPDFEIIVLDDNSTDRTSDVASKAGLADPKIRLLRGAVLPEGWTGKSHACAQAAAAARGDWLLFTDADTTFAPDALARLVESGLRYEAGLLSLVPEQRMMTFWERTFLPLLHYVAMCFLPIPLVSRTRASSLAMANGQCMLFRRDAYAAIGGHTSVRDVIVEDVWLARAIKRAGHRLIVGDGTGVVSCRMYTSLRAIRDGFTKNLFPGLNASVLFAIGVLLWTAASGIVPVVWCPVALLTNASSWITLLVVMQCALMIIIRLLLSAKFCMSLAHIILHPIAMALLCWILMRSTYLYVFGGGAQWKDRTMSLTPEHP